MLVSHDSLANYMKTNFSLMQFHNYSLSDIENMIPWERLTYIKMLTAHVARVEEEKRDRIREMERNANRRR